MAMTLEEVLLKLKLDSSTVVQDMNKFKESINQGTQHAHKSFLHAESAGRSFHKLMEKITEQSPLMGTAFKLAMNPVVGTLTAATLAFTYFNKKIEEANKRLDEMRDKNARPFGNLESARNATEGASNKMKEAAYETGHMPGGAADEWVKEGMGYIKGMAPGPARDAMVRALYLRARWRMGMRAKGLGGDLGELRAGIVARAGSLAKARGQAESLKESIGELERERPALQETLLGSSETASYSGSEAKAKLDALQHYKDLLAQTEHVIRRLTDEDFRDNQAIREKTEEYKKLRDALPAINRAIGGLPVDQQADLFAYGQALQRLQWFNRYVRPNGPMTEQEARMAGGFEGGVTSAWQNLQRHRLIGRTQAWLDYEESQKQLDASNASMLVNLLLYAIRAEGIPITPGAKE